jgi:hypothetical protein
MSLSLVYRSDLDLWEVGSSGYLQRLREGAHDSCQCSGSGIQLMLGIPSFSHHPDCFRATGHLCKGPPGDLAGKDSIQALVSLARHRARFHEFMLMLTFFSAAVLWREHCVLQRRGMETVRGSHFSGVFSYCLSNFYAFSLLCRHRRIVNP